MSRHMIVKCDKCGKVIQQCRCICCNKEVRYLTCDECKKKEKRGKKK